MIEIHRSIRKFGCNMHLTGKYDIPWQFIFNIVYETTTINHFRHPNMGPGQHNLEIFAEFLAENIHQLTSNFTLQLTTRNHKTNLIIVRMKLKQMLKSNLRVDVDINFNTSTSKNSRLWLPPQDQYDWTFTIQKNSSGWRLDVACQSNYIIFERWNLTIPCV